MARALQLPRRLECAVGLIMAHWMIEKTWKKEHLVERQGIKKKKRVPGLNPDLALEGATSLNVDRPAK